jgi:hypothetical protein
MKQGIIVIWTALALVSCNGVNKEDYANAVIEMCTCITAEQEKAKQNEVFSNDIMYYATCSFEVEEKYTVDIENSEFDRAMSIHCPKLLALHNTIKTKIIGSTIYE